MVTAPPCQALKSLRHLATLIYFHLLTMAVPGSQSAANVELKFVQSLLSESRRDHFDGDECNARSFSSALGTPRYGVVVGAARRPSQKLEWPPPPDFALYFNAPKRFHESGSKLGAQKKTFRLMLRKYSHDNFFDEMLDGDGAIRPHYRQLLRLV